MGVGWGGESEPFFKVEVYVLGQIDRGYAADAEERVDDTDNT